MAGSQVGILLSGLVTGLASGMLAILIFTELVSYATPVDYVHETLSSDAAPQREWSAPS